MDEEIDDAHFDLIRDIVAQLGVADGAAFGLTWENPRSMLESLGYHPKLAFKTL